MFNQIEELPHILDDLAKEAISAGGIVSILHSGVSAEEKRDMVESLGTPISKIEVLRNKRKLVVDLLTLIPDMVDALHATAESVEDNQVPICAIRIKSIIGYLVLNGVEDITDETIGNMANNIRNQKVSMLMDVMSNVFETGRVNLLPASMDSKNALDIINGDKLVGDIIVTKNIIGGDFNSVGDPHICGMSGMDVRILQFCRSENRNIYITNNRRRIRQSVVVDYVNQNALISKDVFVTLVESLIINLENRLRDLLRINTLIIMYENSPKSNVIKNAFEVALVKLVRLELMDIRKEYRVLSRLVLRKSANSAYIDDLEIHDNAVHTDEDGFNDFFKMYDLKMLVATEEDVSPELKTILDSAAEVSTEGLLTSLFNLFRNKRKLYISQGKELRTDGVELMNDKVFENLKLKEEFSIETKRKIIKTIAGLMVVSGARKLNNGTVKQMVTFMNNYNITKILDTSVDFLTGKEEDFSVLKEDVNGISNVFTDSSTYFGFFNKVTSLVNSSKRGFVARKIFLRSNNPIMMQQVVGFGGDTIDLLFVVNVGDTIKVKLTRNKIKSSYIESLTNSVTALDSNNLKDLLNAANKFNNRKGLLINRFDKISALVEKMDINDDGSQYLKDRQLFVSKVVPYLTKVSLIDLKDANDVLDGIMKLARFHVGMIKRKVEGKVVKEEDSITYELNELMKEM